MFITPSDDKPVSPAPAPASSHQSKPASGRVRSATASSSSTAVLVSTDGATSDGIISHGGLSSSPSNNLGHLPTTVRCYRCDESLVVPKDAHVMSCQFCKQVFLYREGRPIGKPIFHDGVLDRILSRRFSFGSNSKTRYFVLTNTELSFYKTMDTFLTHGESASKGTIQINSTTNVDTDVGLGRGDILFTVQTRKPSWGRCANRASPGENKSRARRVDCKHQLCGELAK